MIKTKTELFPLEGIQTQIIVPPLPRRHSPDLWQRLMFATSFLNFGWISTIVTLKCRFYRSRLWCFIWQNTQNLIPSCLNLTLISVHLTKELSCRQLNHKTASRHFSFIDFIQQHRPASCCELYTVFLMHATHCIITEIICSVQISKCRSTNIPVEEEQPV